MDACINTRCNGDQGCMGEPGKPGMMSLCATQICKAEKPCVIKCRASSMDACGVDDEHAHCRRRYMVGCIDEECHNKRRNAHTQSPEVVRDIARARERKLFLKSEMPCDVMCKMQAYKKCGVTTSYTACRTVYRKDCKKVQCKEPKCERACRTMAFSACGAGARFDTCREDYRQLCRPIRCRRTVCLRESLLECGEEKCRREYVRGCMKRKTKKWKDHVEALKKVPTLPTVDTD